MPFVRSNSSYLRIAGKGTQMDTLKALYQQMLPFGGFLLNTNKSNIEENQFCYTLSSDKGSGEFWYYLYEDMFTIQKQNFCFYEDFFIESLEPEFLALQYFSSVSGEEFQPYTQLSPNSFRAYVGGGEKTYRAVYHKDIPIRSVSVSIMPDFYDRYLRDKFEGEYIDPQGAFRRITLERDFPQLIALLKQIQTYSGNGMSAKMFYEGKILEALAFIIDITKGRHKQKIRITKQDEKDLQAVIDYINHHYAFPVSLEHLSKIAFMGKTKLKTIFKEYVGCNISNYIIQKRIPYGYEAQIRPRSGLAKNNGITVLNSPGTIDAGYRGEIKVIMINHSENEFIIKPGDKIAQLVIAPVLNITFVETDNLNTTQRGANGFGSTGI